MKTIHGNILVLKLMVCVLFGLSSNYMFAQGCLPFKQESNGKPLKVSIYTKLDLCFSIINEAGMVNSIPSKRVTYYMDYQSEIITLNIGDSVKIEKKIVGVNTDIASVVYELIFKKGKYELKNKPFEISLTDQAKQEQQDQIDQMEEVRKKRNAEWDEKIAEKKKKREEKGNEETEEKVRSESKTNTVTENNAKPVESIQTNSNSINSHSDKSIVTVSSTITPSGYPISFIISYQDKPIKNQQFVIVADTKEKKELMRGITNADGLVTMYHHLDFGKYDVEICLEFNGVRHTGLSNVLTFGNTENTKAFLIDYDKSVSNLIQMTKQPRSNHEKYFGLDKINK